MCVLAAFAPGPDGPIAPFRQPALPPTTPRVPVFTAHVAGAQAGFLHPARARGWPRALRPRFRYVQCSRPRPRSRPRWCPTPGLNRDPTAIASRPVPVQKPEAIWQVILWAHSVPPSGGHFTAQVPPAMHASPVGRAAVVLRAAPPSPFRRRRPRRGPPRLPPRCRCAAAGVAARASPRVAARPPPALSHPHLPPRRRPRGDRTAVLGPVAGLGRAVAAVPFPIPGAAAGTLRSTHANRGDIGGTWNHVGGRRRTGGAGGAAAGPARPAGHAPVAGVAASAAPAPSAGTRRAASRARRAAAMTAAARGPARAGAAPASETGRRRRQKDNEG